jgi:hypothetical protein
MSGVKNSCARDAVVVKPQSSDKDYHRDQVDEVSRSSVPGGESATDGSSQRVGAPRTKTTAFALLLLAETIDYAICLRDEGDHGVLHSGRLIIRGLRRHCIARERSRPRARNGSLLDR